MCGIVGLFLKDKSLELRLGEMLTDMLVTMSDRGPDSAGIAIYKSPNSSYKKITLQSSNPTKDFKNLKTSLDKLIHQGLEISIIDTHAIINFETKYLEQVKALLGDHFSFLKIMSIGDSIEIYKEVPGIFDEEALKKYLDEGGYSNEDLIGAFCEDIAE